MDAPTALYIEKVKNQIRDDIHDWLLKNMFGVQRYRTLEEWFDLGVMILQRQRDDLVTRDDIECVCCPVTERGAIVFWPKLKYVNITFSIN